MQIKSWQIALMGILAELFVVPLILYPGASISDIVSFGFFSFIYASSIAVILCLSGVTLLLLFFDKTRKFGAMLGIIFGIVIFLYGIVYGVYAMKAKVYVSVLLGEHMGESASTAYAYSLSYGGIAGIFLLLAGVNYFRKKV